MSLPIDVSALMASPCLHKRVMALQARLLTQGLAGAPGAWGRITSLLSDSSVFEILAFAALAGASVTLVGASLRVARRRPATA